MALIAPVSGSIDTTAEAGSVRYGRILSIAWFAARWSFGSIVV